MPLYKPQSLNESGSQVPNFTPRYSYAECPTEETVMKRCSHVNVNSVGHYAFLYETTSSMGGTTTEDLANYITGSKVNHTSAGGIKLDASPVAWRRTDAAGAVGDITFVYVRVR